jgi:hypothetical protein
MLRLLTTTAIVAALLAAWLAATAVRTEGTRPVRNVDLAPSEVVIAAHRQLHRHLVWVVGKKIRPAVERRVDWDGGRATTCCQKEKNPAEA